MKFTVGRRAIFLVSAVFLLIFLFAVSSPVHAQSIHELRQNIQNKNEEIKKLEEQKKKYQQEILKNQAWGKTLKQEIGKLDSSIKALSHDIAITEKKIGLTQLEINSLAYEISETDKSIQNVKNGLGSVLSILAKSEEETRIEVLLKYDTISRFFRHLAENALLQNKMLAGLAQLHQLRSERADDKTEQEQKKSELENLENLLGSRKKVQVSTKTERSSLLAVTKNQEKAYQALVREQERKRAELEQEIAQYEERLRIIINQSLLPTQGHGVLGYPLPYTILSPCSGTADSNQNNCITQYFGNTSFAASGAYQGKGHNGMDFRADIGMPVLAAESGTVQGIGDTDLGCKKASYGKWILVRHPNNLATLYTHLSVVNVAPNAQVTRGSTIGLSGSTGYATGPHLHFSVYAAEAVRIDTIQSKVCGRPMTLPLSPTNGYLNPLSYL